FLSSLEIMSEDCFLIFCICFDLLSCCSPFCEDSCPWIMGSCVSKQHGGRGSRQKAIPQQQQPLPMNLMTSRRTSSEAQESQPLTKADRDASCVM
ncbi:unnamed protein product, partial [Mycena citricolor]